jgi:hypothetical protein
MAVPSVTILDGNSAAKTMSVLQDAASNNIPSQTADCGQQTFRASATFTPYATSAIALFQIKGSATKTVRVKRVLVSGAATALADTLFRMTLLSASGTGGTAVTPTIAKLDSASSTATAVVTHWTTAAQSAGTVTSVLSHWRQFIATVTTPATAYTNPQQVVFPEAGMLGQAIVLRGTSEFLQVENLNGGNLGAATVLEYVIEWVEDAS